MAASAAKKVGRPFVLGLTGGIGMGKTAVATHFRALGFPVHDTDAAVHQLYGRDGKGAAAVAARWGSDNVLGQDGAVDRQKLWQMIQESPTVLAEIEKIVHPLVAEHRNNFLVQNADAFLAVLDVPLLFETKMEGSCDAVVVASAIDPAIQRERVLCRPGMTPEKLEHILEKQVPDESKRSMADYVINTSDPSMSPLRNQVALLVDRLVGDRTKEFARWLAPPGHHSIGTPKIVALDLDDTIWNTDLWIAEMSDELIEPVLAEHMPKAYASGTRYRDETTLATIKHLMETVPGIAHDHAELRRRAYLSAAAASNDDPNGVEVVIKAYLRNRSEAAFRHLYADTLPFLAEIRKRGALIAAISDGNGDVTLSDTLNGLFDFSVSAVSAGADKAHVAQFLQVLTQGRQRLGPGLVAQDIIVVGDNFSKDVIGSVKSGVRAAWLCREGATPRGEITGGEEAFCREHDVVIIDGLHVDAIFTPRTQVPTIPPSM